MPVVIGQNGELLVYNRFGRVIEDYSLDDLPKNSIILSSNTHSVLIFNTPSGKNILMQHPEHDSIYIMAMRGCILCAALSPNYLAIICDGVLLIYTLGQQTPTAEENGCVLDVTNIRATYDDLFIFDIARNTTDVGIKMYQLFSPNQNKFIDEVIVESHIYPSVKNNKFSELFACGDYNPEIGLYRKNDTWYDIEDDIAVFYGNGQKLAEGHIIAKTAIAKTILSSRFISLNRKAILYVRELESQEN